MNIPSVFKGADGLKKLAEADAFWEKQEYGTRLYFGEGITDYLHRGVLQAAVQVLEATPAQQEAVAWQCRYYVDGVWGPWHNLEEDDAVRTKLYWEEDCEVRALTPLLETKAKGPDEGGGK